MSVYTSSHSTEIAEVRKNAISELLQFVETNNQIRDNSATITFLYEDERTLPTSTASLYPSMDRADSMPIAHGGKIKMNLTIVEETVRLLIEHCQDLPTLEFSHTAPEPYVKIYLINSTNERMNETKRKTTISHRTCHPTFNQVIDYAQMENVKEMSIEVSVWSYLISGNVPLGKIELRLDKPSQKGWFPLQPKWK